MQIHASEALIMDQFNQMAEKAGVDVDALQQKAADAGVNVEELAQKAQAAMTGGAGQAQEGAQGAAQGAQQGAGQAAEGAQNAASSVSFAVPVLQLLSCGILPDALRLHALDKLSYMLVIDASHGPLFVTSTASRNHIIH